MRRNADWHDGLVACLQISFGSSPTLGSVAASIPEMSVSTSSRRFGGGSPQLHDRGLHDRRSTPYTNRTAATPCGYKSNPMWV